MTDGSAPALSVILPTSNGFATISRTVRALHAQTIRDRLELVIVAPSESITIERGLTEGFAGVRVIAFRNVTSSSNRARVAGIRVAGAPIVALAEDHSFPEPRWAEALLAAHAEGKWAAVGPVVCNANPATAVSWANILIEYAPWLEPAQRGEVAHLPGHNSSYRRDLLLEYGEKLDALMESETVMHWDLIRRGHRLLIEPAARTHHLNFSKLSSCVTLRFNVGRQFASMRSTQWPFPKRLMYAVAAPLIPAVRLRRIGTLLIRRGRIGLMLRILPVLVPALLVDGFGELVGYTAGPGSSPSILGGIEFDRRRVLSGNDRNDYDAGKIPYGAAGATEREESTTRIS